MPANSRPFPVYSDRNTSEAVAAVIRFKAGPDQMARIQAWLNKAAAAGVIEQATAQAYDPERTSAVLYFP